MLMSLLTRAFLLTAALLGGCDMLGLPSAEKDAAQREAESKAIGAACRHAGRAIEDCYVLNKKADKAAVFTGWRDMNDYMRENKIDAVAPQLPAPGASKPAPKADIEEVEEAEPAAKGSKPAASH